MYFLILGRVYDIDWPTDLWLGTTGLAGLTGGLLSFLAVPPAVEGAVWVEAADEATVAEAPPDAAPAPTLLT